MEEMMKKRREVSVEQTWDLSLIYKTPLKMESELARMQKLCAQIVETYEGKLTTAQAVNACLELYREEQKIAILCGDYASLALSADHGDAALQRQNDRVMEVIARCESDLRFLETEIAALDEAVLVEAIIAQAKGEKDHLQDVLHKKPHRLHPETEHVMTALSRTTDLSYEDELRDIYDAGKLADMRFDDFTVGGKAYPLSYSLFENVYEYETDTAVRRAAFAAFFKKLRRYENVAAAAYNGTILIEKNHARIDGFESLIDSLLFNKNVDRALFEPQIDLGMEKLASYMRRYARLVQQTYGLDEMTFADLKLPLDADYCPTVTIEEAKQYVKESLSVLGEGYLQMLEQDLERRFCHQHSWNGKMSDVFTIVHELGHSGHFILCNNDESLMYNAIRTDHVYEAPPTLNELLLAHDLICKNPDKRFRRWVLVYIVSNTYYHFVPYLFVTAYQREVYRIVDAGGSVSAKMLSGIMLDMLTRFWGEDVKINEGAELIWMRQQRYFMDDMGLNSYISGLALTIATQVCRRIETEGEAAVADWNAAMRASAKKEPVRRMETKGETAVADWKAAMRANVNADPVRFAAMAGVDITTDAALLDTIETIGGYIDEIIKLTEELEIEK